MAENNLDWLVDWYARHCNGNWEHGYGIEIGNIDNPGWRLQIDLSGTELENVPFDEIRHNYEDDVSWSVCWLEDKVFHAACGARDLDSIFAVFRAWAARARSQAG